jgi:Kef-type K+ transport system membrane component KefB
LDGAEPPPASGVAGVGVSSGALSNDIYTTVIIMVAVTTIITPICEVYAKHMSIQP